MKDLTTVSNGVVSDLTGKDTIYAKTTSRQMNDTQKQAVKYFFARLQRVYQSEYRRQVPDESSDRAMRQEFAHLVMGMTKEQMDKGFDELHEQRKLPDSEYKFLNLDAVIELVKNGPRIEGVQSGAYKPFFPKGQRLEEPTELKHRRKEKGIEGCKRVLSIFDD